MWRVYDNGKWWGKDADGSSYTNCISFEDAYAFNGEKPKDANGIIYLDDNEIFGNNPKIASIVCDVPTVAKFMKDKPFDRVYYVAESFDGGTLEPDSWYGMIKTHILDGNAFIIGYMGGGNYKIQSIDYGTELENIERCLFVMFNDIQLLLELPQYEGGK